MTQPAVLLFSLRQHGRNVHKDVALPHSSAAIRFNNSTANSERSHSSFDAATFNSMKIIGEREIASINRQTAIAYMFNTIKVLPFTVVTIIIARTKPIESSAIVRLTNQS